MPESYAYEVSSKRGYLRIPAIPSFSTVAKRIIERFTQQKEEKMQNHYCDYSNKNHFGLPPKPSRDLLALLQVLVLAWGFFASSCAPTQATPTKTVPTQEPPVKAAPKSKPGNTLIKETIKPTAMRELEVFSGRVVSTDREAVAGAQVEVNGKTMDTSDEGYFKIEVKPDKRYVMNIRNDGFGLLSKTYTTGVQEGHWTMTPATVQSFDPTQAIILRNIRTSDVCNGTLSSRVNWSEYPSRRVPHFIDSAGTVSNNVSDEVRAAIAFVEQGDICNPGISLTLPPNSLVDANGTPPAGMVQATISTVDIYDPDSMPGDYTVTANGTSGYMVTFGAGGIVIKGEEDTTYQLREGTHATLTIPINPAQLKRVKKPERTIPLLIYDEKAGVWKQTGEATLNERGDAYVAQLSHFSSFNMDLVKTDQACVRINSNAIDRDYLLEVTVPYGVDVIYRSYLVDNTPVKWHVIYNLPSNTDISLRAFEVAVGITIPITDTIVVNTGNPQNPATPNLPDYGDPNDPYPACNSQVELTEAPATTGPRQISITNQMGTHRLEQIVQVKIIPIGSVYTTDDMLTPDTQTCWNLPGEAVNRGQSRTFDVNIGNDYLVFIGIGIWETDFVTGICPSSNPWIKTRFFTATDFTLYWPWVEVQVTDHFSDTWNWIITGSYLSGDLLLLPDGSPPIPFQVTNYDPFNP